jgi:NAD-dependent dihydropyrimidine dehydrogenase PreA subunit
MGRMIYMKDVVTLGFDQVRCVGCGMCTLVCPRGVWSLNNGTAHIQDRNACMECGACATNCPAGAISVKPGVGCAAAVINSVLGRKNSSCCCIVEEAGEPSDQDLCSGGDKPACC